MMTVLEGPSSTSEAAAGEFTDSRTTSPLPRQVLCSNHPLLQHKMTLIRDKHTTGRDFRHLLRELTLYLGYEATSELQLRPRGIESAHGHYIGNKLSERIAIVPILRGGLGMVDALVEILPNAAVYHIGMFSNRRSSLPIQYYNRLPKDRVSDLTYVLDPLIATSGTCSATVSMLKKWGCKKIVVIGVVGSVPGLQKLLHLHPDIKVHVAAIDQTVNEEGYIVPGIGDAGERLFNTMIEDAMQDEDHAACKQPRNA